MVSAVGATSFIMPWGLGDEDTKTGGRDHLVRKGIEIKWMIKNVPRSNLSAFFHVIEHRSNVVLFLFAG